MTDEVYSFLIDGGISKGQAVRLTETLDVILGQHRYPERVGSFLAEACTLAVLLSASIKYDGLFTLQIQSDGPVSTLVVNMTSDGKIRGYARFDEQRLEEAEKKMAEQPSAPVPAFFGQGALSFIVEQPGDAENYQGVVALERATLAECVHQYFRQSEQIETAVRLSVGKPDSSNAGWSCGAVMLQRMPADKKTFSKLGPEEIEEIWRTAVILLNSVTDRELQDVKLPVEKLVHRLYHLNDLHVFMPKKLEFGCRCSQEKVREMLKRFSPEDRKDMVVDGKIKVDCQFCGRSYTLTLKDLESGE